MNYTWRPNIYIVAVDCMAVVLLSAVDTTVATVSTVHPSYYILTVTLRNYMVYMFWCSGKASHQVFPKVGVLSDTVFLFLSSLIIKPTFHMQ